ncbi:hypothetical protein ACFLSJ_07695, partial [Verrucomicrobiota bacterium]
MIEVLFEPGTTVRLRGGRLTDLDAEAGKVSRPGLSATLDTVGAYAWQRACSSVSEDRVDKLREIGERKS